MMSWIRKLQKSFNGGRLVQAAKAGDAAACKRLLIASDARAMDGDGHTALMHAAFNGHADVVKLIMGQSDPFAVDRVGKTALMYAVLSRRPMWAVELLSARRMVPVAGSFQREMDAQVKIVELMAPSGHANSQDQKGMTALMHAARMGRPRVVEVLLPFCRVGAVDFEGRTAAGHARLGGYFDLAGSIDAYQLSVDLAHEVGDAGSQAAKRTSRSL